MPSIEFTTEELQVQVNLNDIAVKAAGLQVAEAVVVLSKKYQAALAVKEPVKEKTSDKPPKAK